MKTIIETYLPIFNGFYHTYFEPSNEDDEIEDINEKRMENGLIKLITYDQCNWDYEGYRKEVVEKCVNKIGEKLNEVLGGEIKLTNQGLISPKFYNFSNDSINVAIELNNEAYDSLIQILRDNDKEFKEFIKTSYSSCDGFISSHSRFHTEWLEALKTKDQDLLSHKLGAVLGFILSEVEEYKDRNLLEDTEYTHLNATNYNELCENETVES